ncbi:MAG: hypothetical protein WCL23_04720 [Candidatus Moraniibacteriota bacterium]
MNNDIILRSILAIVMVMWKALQQSVLFSLVILFLKIYSAVLLIDFVLILFNRNLGHDYKKLRYGAVRPLMSPSVAEKRWKEIQSRLDGQNAAHYKVAVLEADAFIEKLVGQMGYEGKNLKDRLEHVRDGKIISLQALREAHEVRNRIVREEDLLLSHDEAKEALTKFQKLLEELRLL